MIDDGLYDEWTLGVTHWSSERDCHISRAVRCASP